MPNPIMKKATRPPMFDEDLTDEPLTFFCPPTLPGPDGLPLPVNPTGSITSISKCQLEVDLSSIVFDHHHLFSLEHYLTRRLSESYIMYGKTKTSQATKDLEKRLEILHQSVEELRAKQSSWNETEKEFQSRRLDTYREEIKTIRAEKDADSLKERELTRSLLKIWKEIRDVRNQQGFSNTNHKLSIKKESVNVNSDKQKWDLEIERELQEAKEDFETNYEKMMNDYVLEMEKWKEVHNKRREARKRQKQRQKDAEKGKGSADATEMAEDDALLVEPEAEKPEEPKYFNEKQMKTELENKAMDCRRPPGEPKIYLELMTALGNGNNNDNVHDNREIQRRTAVSKTKVFTRIFFNGKEVCQSSSRPIHPDFVIQIGQIFPIQIVQLPETLKLQIIEGGTIKSTMIAEIKLPISEPTKTLSDCQLEPIEFKSTQLIKHEDHSGLGSGYTFATSVDGSDINTEYTKGRLFARVGWARGTDGKILSPPVDQWCPRKDSKLDPLHDVMEPDGKIDPIKLEKWIVKARLDPNDPENEELISKVNEARRKVEIGGGSTLISTSKTSHLGSTISAGYFRLDQHHDQLIFCTDEEIQNNPRFQMIQLRRAKVPEFKNYRMIPILDKEVPKGLLEARTKKALAKGREVMDKGDPLRGRSRLYLEQLRTQVNHRFSLARHRRRHGDVINEDPIPDSGTLMMICGEMVPAQRPLRPIRIERKKVLMQDLTNQDIKILLSIVRAYDVPVRSDVDPLVQVSASGPMKIRKDSGLCEASVYSYVEAQFQGQTLRTTVAIGPNPAWNQELTLIFKSSNNDFSPETLNQVKDSLHLHLFDEVTVDLVEDDNDVESHVHQRIEKKWLGSLSIPFSSLYRNTRIEGAFKLHSPPVLLGYERSGVVGGLSIESTEASIIHGLGGGLAKNAKNATYLNIYATLQPALIVPEPVKEKLDCDEPEHVVQHCLDWSESLAQKYPQRKINPMVADVTGKSVLLTRYAPNKLSIVGCEVH